MTILKTIVCAGATHHEHLLDSYTKQLMKADIPFHLQSVSAMPNGPNSMTMRRKIEFVRQMATLFVGHYDRIIISDAFDVQFCGTLPRDLPFLLISAEANLYPEPNLAPLFTSEGPWKYVNAGLMIGSPGHLFAWCAACEKHGELGTLDQQWLNRRHSEGFLDLVPIDSTTQLFYTVTRDEHQTLEMRGDSPYNTIHHTHPCFFHFSGRTPVAPFRAMLRGDTSSL
jgi:hypothetical protein